MTVEKSHRRSSKITDRNRQVTEGTSKTSFRSNNSNGKTKVALMMMGKTVVANQTCNKNF